MLHISFHGCVLFNNAGSRGLSFLQRRWNKIEI
jgi:hypothetical protein